MDIKLIGDKINIFLKKYKFIILVLLIGFVLILLPESKDQRDIVQTPTVADAAEKSFEDKLAEILTQIEGAGKVKVLLTVSEGEEIIFQTDEDVSNSNDASSKDSSTVTVTDASKSQNGLVRQIIPPSYRGAIIVCQGADDPTVRLSVTEAVAKITGIGTNCISVLKMK